MSQHINGAAMHETDGELLARFAATGCQASFSELVGRHGPMVLRTCRRLCSGDAHAAEDAAQQVFLTLASRASVLKTRVSLAGWIYRTAWHVATHQHRDRTTRKTHEREAAALRAADATGVNGNDIPFAVSTSELSDRLNRALATLPENYRDALVLHHFAGHSVEQTAATLGVKVGTAASWLSRGRGVLRSQLEGCGYAVSAEAIVLWFAEEGFTEPQAGAGWSAIESKIVESLCGAAKKTVAVSVASASFGMSRAAVIALAAATVGGTGWAAGAVVPGRVAAIFTPIANAVAEVKEDIQANALKEAETEPRYASASPVPEPSSATLLLGIGGFLLARRRRAAGPRS